MDRARADLIVILGCADSYELQYKNRYAGEISLELTYFINVSRIMLRLRLRILQLYVFCVQRSVEIPAYN